MDNRNEYAYQAFYCEENVWQFLKEKAAHNSDDYAAVFITNAGRHVALAQQRNGDEQGFVMWDYHVVALSYQPTPLVWDFDTRLPWPCPAIDWLDQTFSPFRFAPEIYQPKFKICKAMTVLQHFQSDRRHMRCETGQWLQPPPDWPTIGREHNLDAWLDLSSNKLGMSYELNALIGQLG
tara:strand:+ start:572 stop:1108 length:537 start_codon:yes stop_codon:yes gene_type:complete